MDSPKRNRHPARSCKHAASTGLCVDQDGGLFVNVFAETVMLFSMSPSPTGCKFRIIQAGFFAKESESPAFFQIASEPRMKDKGSFFSAKGPEEEPQAKEPEAGNAGREGARGGTCQEQGFRGGGTGKDETEGRRSESVAAKCSCGCGGSETCVKSAAPDEEREQPKAPANETSAHQPAAAGAAHKDCSPAQESTAASAASQAGILARRAQQAAGGVASLGDDPASTATGHCERWFGRIDGHRVQLVRDTFAAIASSMSGTLTLRCDSEKNVYAYVKSCGSKEIYLGRLFWSRARNTGIDSRPGVILHEMAHDVSRLIGDHSYGAAGAEDGLSPPARRELRGACHPRFKLPQQYRRRLPAAISGCRPFSKAERRRPVANLAQDRSESREPGRSRESRDAVSAPRTHGCERSQHCSLHACLQAINRGENVLRFSDIQLAIDREYRKEGRARPR